MPGFYKLTFTRNFLDYKCQSGIAEQWQSWGVSRQGWDTAAIQRGTEPQGWSVTSTAHQGMVSGGDGSEEPRAGLWGFNLVFSKE